MPASGRRRQSRDPWHRRIRWDLLGWGVLAGLAAGLALGLTGGGWGRAALLAGIVVAACVVLTLLAAMPSGRPGRGGGGPST